MLGASSLAGRTCLITGASRGLGASLAAAFWEHGANLILTSRSHAALALVREKLPDRPRQQCVLIEADLSDPAAPGALIHAARAKAPKLDALVNNAATLGPIGPVWTNDWTQWLDTQQVNYLAPVRLCSLVVPWMIEHGYGKIVNMSGGGAASPRVNFTAYAAAKAALVRFSETLALEVAGRGIDVNCVAPGGMFTQKTAAVLDAGPAVAGEKEFAQANAIRASGSSALVRATDLCVFLAGAVSDGISGKLISAVWDPWATLSEHQHDLKSTDIYTLRRIVPGDRGFSWDNPGS
jgi:3-oxoacyl-[acyl-carrier protein] reductase